MAAAQALSASHSADDSNLGDDDAAFSAMLATFGEDGRALDAQFSQLRPRRQLKRYTAHIAPLVDTPPTAVTIHQPQSSPSPLPESLLRYRTADGDPPRKRVIVRKSTQVHVDLSARSRSPLHALNVANSQQLSPHSITPTPTATRTSKPHSLRSSPSRAQPTAATKSPVPATKPTAPKRSRQEILSFMKRQKAERRQKRATAHRPSVAPTSAKNHSHSAQRHDHSDIVQYMARKARDDHEKQAQLVRDQQQQRQQVAERLKQLELYRLRQRRRISPPADNSDKDEASVDDSSSVSVAPSVVAVGGPHSSQLGAEPQAEPDEASDSALAAEVTQTEPLVATNGPQPPTAVSDIWTPLLQSAKLLFDRVERLKQLPDAQLAAFVASRSAANQSAKPMSELQQPELTDPDEDTTQPDEQEIDQTTFSRMLPADDSVVDTSTISSEFSFRPATPLPDPATVLHDDPPVTAPAATFKAVAGPADRLNVLSVFMRHLDSIGARDSILVLPAVDSEVVTSIVDRVETAADSTKDADNDAQQVAQEPIPPQQAVVLEEPLSSDPTDDKPDFSGGQVEQHDQVQQQQQIVIQPLSTDSSYTVDATSEILPNSAPPQSIGEPSDESEAEAQPPRFSPKSLSRRLSNQLNYYDSLQESRIQLSELEKVRLVANTQQQLQQQQLQQQTASAAESQVEAPTTVQAAHTPDEHISAGKSEISEQISGYSESFEEFEEPSAELEKVADDVAEEIVADRQENDDTAAPTEHSLENHHVSGGHHSHSPVESVIESQISSKDSSFAASLSIESPAPPFGAMSVNAIDAFIKKERLHTKEHELLLLLKEKTLEEHAKAEVRYLRAHRMQSVSKNKHFDQKSVKMEQAVMMRFAAEKAEINRLRQANRQAYNDSRKAAIREQVEKLHNTEPRKRSSPKSQPVQEDEWHHGEPSDAEIEEEIEEPKSTSAISEQIADQSHDDLSSVEPDEEQPSTESHSTADSSLDLLVVKLKELKSRTESTRLENKTRKVELTRQLAHELLKKRSTQVEQERALKQELMRISKLLDDALVGDTFALFEDKSRAPVEKEAYVPQVFPNIISREETLIVESTTANVQEPIPANDGEQVDDKLDEQISTKTVAIPEGAEIKEEIEEETIEEELPNTEEVIVAEASSVITTNTSKSGDKDSAESALEAASRLMIERIKELSNRVKEAKAAAEEKKLQKLREHAILREKLKVKEQQLLQELETIESGMAKDHHKLGEEMFSALEPLKDIISNSSKKASTFIDYEDVAGLAPVDAADRTSEDVVHHSVSEEALKPMQGQPNLSNKGNYNKDEAVRPASELPPKDPDVSAVIKDDHILITNALAMSENTLTPQKEQVLGALSHPAYENDSFDPETSSNDETSIETLPVDTGSKEPPAPNRVDTINLKNDATLADEISSQIFDELLQDAVDCARSFMIISAHPPDLPEFTLAPVVTAESSSPAPTELVVPSLELSFSELAVKYSNSLPHTAKFLSPPSLNDNVIDHVVKECAINSGQARLVFDAVNEAIANSFDTQPASARRRPFTNLPVVQKRLTFPELQSKIMAQLHEWNQQSDHEAIAQYLTGKDIKNEETRWSDLASQVTQVQEQLVATLFDELLTDTVSVLERVRAVR